MKKEDVELAKEQVRSGRDFAAERPAAVGLHDDQRPMDGVVSDVQIQKGTIISSAISIVGGGTSVIDPFGSCPIFLSRQRG